MPSLENISARFFQLPVLGGMPELSVLGDVPELPDSGDMPEVGGGLMMVYPLLLVSIVHRAFAEKKLTQVKSP
jgi:hypothetical protein